MRHSYLATGLLIVLMCFAPMAADAHESARYVKESIFGGSVYVRLVGDKNKPAVVLVHGLGESASNDWNRTIDLLKSDYRVLALDLPGFGKSDKGNHLYSQANYARLIRQLSNSLVGRKFHLVGHSLGGAIALYYAAVYPDDINTLTLIDAAGILHRAAYAKYLAVFGIEKLIVHPGMLKKSDLLDLAREIVDSLEAYLPIDPAWVLSTRFSREKILQGNPMAIAGLALVSENFSLLAHRVEVPTLIIWGENDSIAPLRTGYVLDSIIPDSSLHILSDIGHAPIREDPVSVYSLLQAHWLDDIKSPIAKEVDQESLEFKADEQCKGSNNKRYTGRFGKLLIQNCRDVIISNAEINELQIVNSSVEILSSDIKGSHLAVEVTNSNVVITASSISGKTGILVGSSQLDIAGSHFNVTREAITVDTESEVVLSLVYKHSASPPNSPLHGAYTLQSGESL